MPNRIAFIDRVEIEIDCDVVHITSGSGDELFRSCMARTAMREHLERAIRQLNDADDRERCAVLEFRAPHAASRS